MESSNYVHRVCIDLEMRRNSEGGEVLQARWLPITLDANKALTPNGPPTDWEIVV
jgi:hypothetical protein